MEKLSGKVKQSGNFENESSFSTWDFSEILRSIYPIISTFALNVN